MLHVELPLRWQDIQLLKLHTNQKPVKVLGFQKKKRDSREWMIMVIPREQLE